MTKYLKFASRVLSFLFCLSAAIVAPPLQAEEAQSHADQASHSPAIEREANDMFASVMSPFCPGRLLHDCPSSEAAKLRNEVRKRFADGQNQEQVFDYLLSLYGEEIRATPTFVIAWVAPFLALALGGLILYLWFRRKRAHADPERESIAIDAATEARINNELDRLS